MRSMGRQLARRGFGESYGDWKDGDGKRAPRMKAKNTICLWFNKDAHDAARFYAATFPDSEVTAVQKAPGDYPSGKAGDVLTVEFLAIERNPPPPTVIASRQRPSDVTVGEKPPPSSRRLRRSAGLKRSRGPGSGGRGLLRGPRPGCALGRLRLPPAKKPVRVRPISGAL